MVGGTFVAVDKLAVVVGADEVGITGAIVGAEGSPKGVLRKGVLTDPQATRKIITNKMNPTRLFFIVIFTSNDSIIHAKSFERFEGVKSKPCHT
jgi:hypothetical protein